MPAWRGRMARLSTSASTLRQPRSNAPCSPKCQRKYITASELAGEKIVKVLTAAPGDGSPIGGVKVIAENGWFAARPSGTEDVYKIYAESFRDLDHLRRIQTEAQAIVGQVISSVAGRAQA